MGIDVFIRLSDVVPDIGQLQDTVYLESINYNVQLIVFVLLGSVSVAVAVGVCLLLYKALIDFF